MRINLPDHAEGTRRGGGRVWHAGSRALTAPTATAARPRRALLCVQCGPDRQPGAAVWGDRVAGTWWRQRCHPVSPRGRGEEGALDKINPDRRRSASASGLEGLVLSLVPHGSRRAREAARAQRPRPRPLPGCSPGPAHGPLGLPSPTQGSVSKHARAVPSVKTLRSRERLRSQGGCRLQGRRSGTPSAPRPPQGAVWSPRSRPRIASVCLHVLISPSWTLTSVVSGVAEEAAGGRSHCRDGVSRAASQRGGRGTRGALRAQPPTPDSPIAA